MKNGWIKLYRKTLENPTSNRPQYLALWIHLLIMANHKDNRSMWNGEEVIIHEGELLTGRKELSRKSGIPETTIEDILKFLERQHQIRQQKTTKFRIITIINWKNYQNGECSDTKPDNRATTERQQSDTNKNDKNVKNDKNTNTGDLTVAGVDDILKVFYKINPTLNWGNKTSRKAAADMIKKFGLPGTITMAEQICSIQGKQYAPTATTPYQMKEKLAQFKIYFDKQKNNQPKIIKA